MPPEPDDTASSLGQHRLSWPDFDALARGKGGPDAIRRLRAAERSRRLLLMRALVDETTKSADMFYPLPSPELAWELLARAQQAAPSSVESILAHPYTGSWLGYTTRLYRQGVSGVCPLWVHIGHVHCLAAAAAIRAGITFEIEVPVWQGNVILPTLGLARLNAAQPASVATVRGQEGIAEVGQEESWVHVLGADPRWQPLRKAVLWTKDRRLSLRLDDVDPYRGLYEPRRPSRLTAFEIESWRTVLDRAWQLLVTHLPAVAEALPEGLESIVPAPAVPFRLPSASTGEAFGSAVIAYSEDPAALAAALVHEFQHIRLGGLLHLTRLHEDDDRERFYAPWRDDPRPLGGVVHGIYAFFGVTAFWRALSFAEPEDLPAAFEFALWRVQTWRTLQAIQNDNALTSSGRRLLAGIAEELAPWQDEPILPESLLWANRAIADHHIGWRIRHLRPDPGTVAGLAHAWRTGTPWPGRVPQHRKPTPIPDGNWPDARTDLIRLRLRDDSASTLPSKGPSVPGATSADIAFVAGRIGDAITGYRRELTADPDSPSALAGLALALSTWSTGPVPRALVRHPELVRAVHRLLRHDADASPEAVAGWIGQLTF
ncbi:HEXXH motif domain-containing protein [Amycolatopsis sp. NPDC048633]|uniref:HEXXH motif domain-containing protein n=1 Tax=Amycolatopsis sp. NPDC048633 TaxID=3157095 RepID=UPI0033E33B1C